MVLNENNSINDNLKDVMHIETRNDGLYINGIYQQKANTNFDFEIKYAQYLKGFFEIAENVFKNNQHEFESFKLEWKNKNYRLAYMHYMKIRDANKIVLSESKKKIETEFYGLFVN